MVGKLIKYDFMSFFRLLLPVQLIIIGIAVINRIVQFFEGDGSVVYSIAFTSSIVLLCVACVVALVMCVVIAIVRFYQGLFSSEGYLSQTLPVTVTQHIWSKLLVSMIFEIGTLFAIFIACNVATIGDVNAEVYKAIGYMLKEASVQVHGHLILYILEGVVLCLLTNAVMYLMFYFCISIGQLVNRKRILLAFGVFFGLYMLGQIVMTIFIIIGVSNPGLWESFVKPITEWARQNPIGAFHVFFCSCIAIDAVFGLVFFLVSRVIMKRRLNLI